MGKLIPLWKIVEETFAKRGIKLSPRLTLVLCDKIAKEINEELGYSPPVKYYYIEETERRLKNLSKTSQVQLTKDPEDKDPFRRKQQQAKSGGEEVKKS